MAATAGRRTMARAACMLAVPMLLGGCAWIGLGWNALTYPVTQAGEAANVVARGDWAYVTRGAAGIEILHLGPAPASTLLALPAALESADDLALADGLLFVLDAQPPGHLAVYSLADPAAPRLAQAPVAVDVGPFSGVAAAGGRVVVSGGTSLLTVRAYGTDGALRATAAGADFGRGQPDVMLDAAGELAVVSTHDWGPHFRLTLVRAAPLAELGALPLDTFGFTAGGARPANFPIETAIAGATVFVAFARGLGIVDIGDPAAPRLLGVLDPGLAPVNVDVREGVAAVVGSQPAPRLALIDVRDRARPRILQSFPLPEGSLATGVALTPTHVVVAAHGRGTLLFDRSKGAWEHIVQLPRVIPTKES